MERWWKSIVLGADGSRLRGFVACVVTGALWIFARPYKDPETQPISAGEELDCWWLRAADLLSVGFSSSLTLTGMQ